MLRISQRDLKAARAMLDRDAFEEATWGYQIQQATEMALKAWISGLGHPSPAHIISFLSARPCDLIAPITAAGSVVVEGR